jgi:hypothetical protein
VRVLPLVLIAVGCGPLETKVGKARLAEADGYVKAPDGPVVEVPGPAITGPFTGAVRIAADREATYEDVRSAWTAVVAHGGQPSLLVANQDHLRALPPDDPVTPADAIKLVAHAGDVRACISPPDTPEATCIARKDHLHIDRAFVRSVVRQAVGAYHLHRVLVVMDPKLGWGDAVRAIDGARTCCEDDPKKIEVSVQTLVEPAEEK